MFKFFFILMACAAPVQAQMLLGAETGPNAFLNTDEARINQQDEDVFSKAFVLENSTSALYAVFESTAPARAAASYMRQGVYRRELLVLFAIARDAGTTFKALAKEREKGATLQSIAKKNKADLMKLFRDSAELQKKIEIRSVFVDVSTAAFAVEAATSASRAGLSAEPPSSK